MDERSYQIGDRMVSFEEFVLEWLFGIQKRLDKLDGSYSPFSLENIEHALQLVLEE
jgi:hypothetical protein